MGTFIKYFYIIMLKKKCNNIKCISNNMCIFNNVLSTSELKDDGT